LSDIRPLLIAHTSQHPSTTDHPVPIPLDDIPFEEIRPPSDIPDPLRSRMEKHEELLEDLRTALTLESPKNPIATMVNNKIDQKIDALRGARAEAKAKLPPPKVDIPSEAMGAIEDVSRKATELSMAMTTPVNDIAHLLIRQSEREKMQATFRTENEELRESLAKVSG